MKALSIRWSERAQARVAQLYRLDEMRTRILFLCGITLLLSGCATKSTDTMEYRTVSVGGKKLSDKELMSLHAAGLPPEQNKQEQAKLIGAIRSSQIDQSLKILHSEFPDYPLSARANGIQGVVTVLFVVDEKGNVCEATVSSSPSKSLSDACLIAIRRWRFAPMTKDGKPVKVYFEQQFPFQLR